MWALMYWLRCRDECVVRLSLRVGNWPQLGFLEYEKEGEGYDGGFRSPLSSKRSPERYHRDLAAMLTEMDLTPGYHSGPVRWMEG